MKTILRLLLAISIAATVHMNRFPDYLDHECIRTCTENSTPLTCEYNFIVENYHTLSKACFDCPFTKSDCYRQHCVPADGVKRGIVVVNRRIPGPAIQVCKGDTVIVHLHNELLTQSTTIHWHGMHQRTTPHSDGVPMVTQCPISPGNSFTYKFKAEPAGTHLYHSHQGIQRADGLFGAVIVREPNYSDPHSDLYDYDLVDHVVVITDWLKELGLNRFSGHHHGDGDEYDNKPSSALINGMGSFMPLTNPVTAGSAETPRQVFTVTEGGRYRFRIISAAIFNCPLKFSVDDHRLTVIASDGRPFEPYNVDSVVLFPGERFDVILDTKFRISSGPATNYWIRVFGLENCANKEVHEEAILRYTGVPENIMLGGNPTYQNGDRIGVELNPLNAEEGPLKTPLVAMNSTEENPDDEWNKPVADVQYFMGFDFIEVDNLNFHDPMLYSIFNVDGSRRLYTPQINGISLRFPEAPALSQYEDLPEDAFCNLESVDNKNCSETFCECVHVIKINLGDVAEIVLVDEGFRFSANHPFHLHGFNFRVVAMERIGVNGEGVSVEEVKELDRKGEIKRKLQAAPLKDTVTVPDGGYTIIRFHADNPGFWLFHCHIDFHLEEGMGFIVQVGEISDMQERPIKFPTCGNWNFEGYEDSDMQCSSGASKPSAFYMP